MTLFPVRSSYAATQVGTSEKAYLTDLTGFYGREGPLSMDRGPGSGTVALPENGHRSQQPYTGTTGCPVA